MPSGDDHIEEGAAAGLVDTHCHLDLLKGTPDEALAETRAAGIEAIVAVGIDLPSSRTAEVRMTG